MALRIEVTSAVLWFSASVMLGGCSPRSPGTPPPGGGGGGGAPPPPSTIDCGSPSSFDTDGDGISDAVERNNGDNGYADLETGRCDEDPSRAEGSPSNGTLSGGLNLPDRGTGYRHFLGTDPVDKDDWGTLRSLNCLEAVGRAVEGTDVLLGYGDISLRGGGPFPPHASHQNGLDSDIRYVRKDRQQAPLDLRIEPEGYDPEATKEVFEAIFNLCPVDVIFVDLERIGFTISGQENRIVHEDGHSNHFHVRVRGV